MTLPKPKLTSDQLLPDQLPGFCKPPSFLKYEDVLVIVDGDFEDPLYFLKDGPLTESCKADPIFNCLHCSNVFKSKKGLSQHIGKKHNSKKKNSSCSLCPKKFRTKYAVQFHIKQVHMQATKVNCPYCATEHYNKYALNRHIANHH